METQSYLPRVSPDKEVDQKKFFNSMVEPVERPRRARSWVPHSYWFIGDVHGNLKEYQAILNKIRKADPGAVTIQLGDIELDDPKDLGFLGEKDFFIHGNHDNVNACLEHKRYLGKFGFNHGLFYIGGAKSNGLGYKNEELSHKELSDALDLYEQTKPDIVVSHDCPHSIREYFFCSKDKTRTSDTLQEMWEIHTPRVWVFGHHHWTQQEVIDGTDFICVSPLQYRQMKLVWNTGYVGREKASKPIEMTAGKALKRWLGL